MGHRFTFINPINTDKKMENCLVFLDVGTNKSVRTASVGTPCITFNYLFHIYCLITRN